MANLILNGTSSYSGPTTVTGGTLSVNGELNNSAVTVSSAGTLSGSGTINGNLSLSGTLAPGTGGIGTATINGDLTMSSSAVLVMEINRTSRGEVKVSGKVTLAGTLDLSNLSGLTLGETITLIENTGDATPTSGYFSEILISGSTYYVSSINSIYVMTVSGTCYALNYAANVDGGSVDNDVTLTVVPEPSTWAYLFTGLGLLIRFQKYRNNKKPA